MMSGIIYFRYYCIIIEIYNSNCVGDSFLYSNTWYSSSRISIVNNLIIYKIAAKKLEDFEKENY